MCLIMVIMAPSLTPRVLRAREQIARRRDEIRHAHAEGASSIQVVNSLATLMDGVIAGMVRGVVASMGQVTAAEFPKRIAFVAPVNHLFCARSWPSSTLIFAGTALCPCGRVTVG
jgi:hypothetical protein